MRSCVRIPCKAHLIRIANAHSQVVVGDIVHLETGNKVPADGIVLKCNDFKCNESALTVSEAERILSVQYNMHN